MLSISQPMKGAGKAHYYLELAREDYYLSGGEPPGQWYGKGAEFFTLSGDVSREQLQALLLGYDPVSNEQLVQNAGTFNRQSGWDLTFSAPKSVSTFWSQAPADVRQIIENAHNEAVRVALDYLQEEAGYTRRGRGGNEVEKADLIFAIFEHGTSRALDPQLHSHALLINSAVRSDRTTGTVVSKDIFVRKKLAGALYRTELAASLQASLGLSIEADRTSFRLKGVSKALVNLFSKRRTEILKEMSERGVYDAVTAKAATLKTRATKAHATREDLFRNWTEAGIAHGWTRKEALALTQAVKIPKNREQALKLAVSEALAQLTTHESYFREIDLMRVAAEKGQCHGVRAKAICREVENLLASKDIVTIRQDGRNRIVTTQAILDMEAALLTAADLSKANRSHAVRGKHIRETLREHPIDKLSEQQREAVLHITGESGSIAIVAGRAGTGKSTMLNVAREVWEKDSYKVIGAALAGKAARGLAESAGIQSTSIQKVLWDLEHPNTPIHIRHAKVFPKAPQWNPLSKWTIPHLTFSNPERITLDAKTILVIDEAGMVGTDQMKRLVDHTQKSGAKLVLVGDEKQLQPIEAGGPFAAMSRILGVVRLTNIQRQHDDKDKDIVGLFADGKVREAIQKAADQDCFHVLTTREKAKIALIQDWAEKGGLTKPESHLIVTATNEEAKDLSQKAQDERLKSGKLNEQVIFIGNTGFHVGDRVLFTERKKELGIENGFVGTITKVKGDILSVQIDNDKAVLVPTKTYRGIQLGYAVTTHKAQGMTTGSGYVLLGKTMQDLELSYVQASRAKGQTHLYVDKQTAGESAEQLIQRMENSGRKKLAIDIMREEAIEEEESERRREEERLRRLEEERQRRERENQQRSRTESSQSRS